MPVIRPPVMRPHVFLWSLLCFMPCLSASEAQGKTLLIAATTSTENSGLMDFILPHFEEAYGLSVQLLVAGSGQVLEIGRRGDSDVLIVHDPEAERQFIRQGHATLHIPFMTNDFIVVGPSSDPCRIKEHQHIYHVFRQFHTGCGLFVSRGDHSGTHSREKALWKGSGSMPMPHATHRWYIVSGSGMGATLNIATAQGAYTLTDRATWLNFANKSTLTTLYQGENEEKSLLENIYSVILPHIHRQEDNAHAILFAQWLRSPEGKALIANYHIQGEQAFFPLP
ncbi:MAG: substrate-binding domain-containing protein [Alphaproteobacteria bacterium GM7ARS4]|nr:substrate-binding domain-containing protein [Alphaproteobacteria bacterium GM7ARS4]